MPTLTLSSDPQRVVTPTLTLSDASDSNHLLHRRPPLCMCEGRPQAKGDRECLDWGKPGPEGRKKDLPNGIAGAWIMEGM